MSQAEKQPEVKTLSVLKEEISQRMQIKVDEKDRGEEGRANGLRRVIKGALSAIE